MAARRIESLVADRIERNRRFRVRGWALAAAPALLILVALFWMLPRGGGDPGYFLVSEDQFAEYLGEWESGGGDLGEILEIDYELSGDDWSSEKREAFLSELESFSLDTI